MSHPSDSRTGFRKLHESGCFVIPNPWDIGSAKYLQSLGFRALATTSAGFAYSIGRVDSPDALPCEVVLRHVEQIVNATDLPVNADFQNGYADEPEEVAANVLRCVRTGVAGLSIEDSTGRKEQPLYETSMAVERLIAATEAIAKSGDQVMLTARAECFLVGHPNPLDEAVKRVRAYKDAGADVLFAPCPATRENIRAIVEAAAPKPVNVIASAKPDLSVQDIAELGARRISVGSALARAAWAGFMRAVKPLAEGGASMDSKAWCRSRN